MECYNLIFAIFIHNEFHTHNGFFPGETRGNDEYTSQDHLQ